MARLSSRSHWEVIVAMRGKTKSRVSIIALVIALAVRGASQREDSHRATVCCHLANIAHKVKRTIQWDGEKEQIIGDQEANGLLSLPRRPGYELPKA